MSSPATPLSPIAAQERIQLLDALRGFALLGVLIANLVWLVTDMAVTREQMLQLPTAAIDGVLWFFVVFFVDGKFYTLFSFLFGLGFSVMLIRAEERGGSAVSLYRRRLLVLLLIGLAHAFFLWYGDILHLYAILGAVLLLSRRFSDRFLLVAALVLILAVPMLVKTGKYFVTSARTAEQVIVEESERKLAWQQTFTHGSYAEVVRTHAGINMFGFWGSGFAFMMGAAVLGKFYLGLLVGRRRILHEPQRYLPQIRRAFYWALLLGIVGNTVYVGHRWAELNHLYPTGSLLLASTRWLVELGHLCLSAAYVCGITLLWQGAAGRRWLTFFSWIGRIPLTNYLTHSLLYALLFYGYAGLGLLGRVGVTGCLLIGAAIYTGQVLFSRWWISRYSIGPAEWVWRSVTYGRWQPMKIARPAAASTAASTR